MDFIKNFFEIFKYMDFRNILDVLILATIFYYIIKTIRGTKAAQLAKGFVFILIVMKLSDMLGFVGLSWIIKGSLNFVVTAFIVIFQPEFRKALEKIGKHSFIVRRKSPEEDGISKLIHILEKSAFRLSSSKTGALMVLSRDVNLNEYYENATMLDAIVSSSLLENIFVNETPLHDGAIIIQDERVKAANCIMPLSEADLPVEYGTRHRAGIGITEICDAVSIIVSEETGKVSICYEGRLIKCTDKIVFQKTLRELLLPSSSIESLKEKRVGLWKNIKSKIS